MVERNVANMSDKFSYEQLKAGTKRARACVYAEKRWPSRVPVFHHRCLLPPVVGSSRAGHPLQMESSGAGQSESGEMASSMDWTQRRSHP